MHSGINIFKFISFIDTSLSWITKKFPLMSLCRLPKKKVISESFHFWEQKQNNIRSDWWFPTIFSVLHCCRFCSFFLPLEIKKRKTIRFDRNQKIKTEIGKNNKNVNWLELFNCRSSKSFGGLLRFVFGLNNWTMCMEVYTSSLFFTHRWLD